jgi:glyoxylase-like metal-dependent hydrolase (beta-lactamase superfamily II)
MGATIHTIPLGIDNVYVVKDKGAVIIDSGAPKKGKAFKKALENVGIKPEEIQLINTWALGSHWLDGRNQGNDRRKGCNAQK